MRHYKRSGVYKNSTGSNSYDPAKREALSYRWWYFVKQFDIGGNKYGVNLITVFNDATYSSSTSRHQRDVKQLMRQLGHTIDLYVTAPAGLQDLDSALKHASYHVKRLSELILAKGSKRQSNLNRCKSIRYWLEKIESLYKNNLINSELRDQAFIYSTENFCANVEKNEGKFIK
jgi:hypothetical protein